MNLLKQFGLVTGDVTFNVGVAATIYPDESI